MCLRVCIHLVRFSLFSLGSKSWASSSISLSEQKMWNLAHFSTNPTLAKQGNVYFSLIYFCIPELFKNNVSTRFLSTKSSFEFVLQCCEFTKVILQSKSWCKMYVLKLSSIQNNLKDTLSYHKNYFFVCLHWSPRCCKRLKKRLLRYLHFWTSRGPQLMGIVLDKSKILLGHNFQDLFRFIQNYTYTIWTSTSPKMQIS